MVAPLVQDQTDEPGEDLVDPEDFAEEQGVVGRFIHLLNADDNDTQFMVRAASNVSSQPPSCVYSEVCGFCRS